MNTDPILSGDKLLDAERWVIGACCFEPGLIRHVAEAWADVRMSSWRTQEPWDALRAAFERGAADPAVDAAVRLMAAGKGGLLDECQDACPSAAEAPALEQARRVAEAAEGKRRAHILAEAAQVAQTDPVRASKLLDHLDDAERRAKRRARAAADARTAEECADALRAWAEDDAQTARVQELGAGDFERWYREHVEILAGIESDVMRDDLVATVNRALGRRKQSVARWRADILAHRSAQQRAADEDPDARRVEDLFPLSGVNGGAVVPEGFRASGDGLARIRYRKDGTPSLTPLAPVPIFVRRRLVDLDTNGYQVELVWPARPDRTWPAHICGRDVIAAARKLPDLASAGLPVTSVSAAGLVEFLAAYEVANQSAIPDAAVSSRFGWLDHPQGFMMGRTFLRPLGAPGSIAVESNAQGALEQVAGALVAEGDPEIERAAIMAAMAHPKVAAAIAGALAAPLLHLVHCPPFTVSLEGTTSKGKSSAAQLAMAAWGRVREQDDATLFRTWAATRVALEALLTSMRGVPLFFDDTARIDPKNRSLVASVIYDVTGGQARARGNVSGDGRAVRSGATVLLSTGETRMLDETQAGGARARVISLSSPLWRDEPGIGETIKGLVAVVERNHGHTARAFLAWLMARPEAWGEFQDDHATITTRIAARIAAVAQRGAAHAAGVIDRLAKSVAVMELALTLAGVSGALPVTQEHIQAMVDAVVLECRANVLESDPFLAALELVAQRALAQPAALWTAGGKEPSGGWIGVRRSELLVLMPEVVEGWLESKGHRHGATLREWGARDWILKDGAHLCPKVEIAGARTRRVCLRRLALVEELGIDWTLSQSEATAEKEEAIRANGGSPWSSR